MTKVVSPISQREVEAIEVDFDADAEPWSTYKLSDGTTLKLRTTVTGVFRLEGEHDQMGNPLYNVSHTTLIRVLNVPKNLKGQPSMGTAPGARTTTAGAGPEVR
ncbi:MAG TPA: hypothetical protein VGR51_09335 [Thermoplasmata archaeon]|jgi:hypothetical protein|nr:hypothetical protein [Thermoplasmata archaeon]